MMSAFSLLKLLAPTAKDGDNTVATAKPPAPAAATSKGKETFLSVMARMHGKAVAKAPVSEAKAQAAPAKTAAKSTVTSAETNTLAAVMAQSRAASSKLPSPPPPSPDVNPKNAASPASVADDGESQTSSDTASEGKSRQSGNSGQPDQPEQPAIPTPLLLLTTDAAAAVFVKTIIEAAPKTAASAPVVSPKDSKVALEKTTVAATAAPISTTKPATVPSSLTPVKSIQPVPTDAAKPPAKLAESSPGPTPILAKDSAPHPAETAESKTQYVAVPASNTLSIVQNSPTSTTGTRGALSGQEMKSGLQKNEFAAADLTASKATAPSGGTTARSSVSTATSSASAPSKTAPASDGLNNPAGGSASNNFGSKLDSTPLPSSALTADLAGKASANSIDAGREVAAAPAPDRSAAQAERVGTFVSQQVLLVRQSSANNLAVSLKLDSQTELNLQLTKQNGQIEAAVRLERGDIPGLGNHWKDLQESLARQNVQLLPLENRSSGRPSSFQQSSQDASTSQQSPQHSPRQGRGQQAEPATVNTTSSAPGATARSASRQGWETWA